MSLIQGFRDGKLTSPADPRFDFPQWLKDARAAEQEEYVRVFAALFAQSFADIRNRYSVLVNASILHEKRAHALFAVLNRECVLVSAKAKLTPTIQHDGQLGVSLDRVATAIVDLPGGQFSVDEVIQTEMDVADSLLRMMCFFPAQAEASSPAPLLKVAVDFAYGSAYATVEHAWLDVVWNDFVVAARRKEMTLAAANQPASRQKAVSWHRYWMLVSEHFGIAFNAALELAKIGALKPDPMPGARFDASASPRSTITVPSSVALRAERIARREAGIPPYYEPFLDKRSSIHAQLTLRCVFDAYLYLIAPTQSSWQELEALLEQETQDGSRLFTAEQYCPSISRASLIAGLAAGIDVPVPVAVQLIAFFTTDPATRGRTTRADLWSAPLFDLGADRLVIALHSFQAGNVRWLVDVWLRRLGFPLESRGDTFEAFARDILRSDLAESPLVDVAEVHPHALLFDGKEIDGVVRIGNQVLLLELKCFLLPITPVDELNYAQKLSEATSQVKRKLEHVRSKPAAFLKRAAKCGLDLPEDARFDAAVVLNQAVGAGQVVDDVPIVDLLMLSHFLEGELRRFGSIGQSGTHSEHHLRLWRSSQDADTALGAYLRDPPQVSLLKQAVAERVLKIPMPALPNQTLYTVHHMIDPDALLAAAAREALLHAAIA